MKTILLFLLYISSTNTYTQVNEKQLQPFLKGLRLIKVSGDGLNQTSGDILLELVSNEPDDYETLVLLRNENGKLKKIGENSNLLMGRGMLGNSGSNYPTLSGNILSINYTVGSSSYQSDITMTFEKNKDGEYYFSTYTSITRNHGVEDPLATKIINTTQTGSIRFSDADENNLLQQAETATSVKEPPVIYEYEPNLSIVSGTLVKNEFYGRPNYGKTPEKDEKILVYILHPESPIHVIATPDQDDPETSDKTMVNIREIQVYSNDKSINFSRLVDKKVKLKGLFQMGRSGGQYTKVLLEVKKIL